MSEEEFINSTPRKIVSLLNIYSEVNNPKKNKGLKNNGDTRKNTSKDETITLKCVD